MKKLFKSILVILVIVGISVTCSAFVARSTNNYTETPNMTNENNLVHTLDEYVSAGGSFTNGLTVKVNSTGSIVINGTYSENATEDYVFTLGTVSIEEADYYTLSGAARGSLDTYYIVASYEDSTGNLRTIISDFSDTCTSADILAEGTQVTLKIVVKPGATLNYCTLKPTFVAGEESGKF